MTASLLRELPPLETLLTDVAARAVLADAIRAGQLCVVRRAVDPALIQHLLAHLRGVGRGSLPNRVATAPACPNHHRAYRADPRSYVRGVYHQFSFFPWNEDIFALFHRFDGVYRLRNLLNDLPERSFLGAQPEQGCIARLSFQYYPRGGGYLNKHADPVDVHQAVVPLLTLSRFGTDYCHGGLYFERLAGERFYVDPLLEPGDILWTFAQTPHGVEVIDPDAPEDWLSFQGRWSAVFAVNRMADSATVADPVDLGQR